MLAASMASASLGHLRARNWQLWCVDAAVCACRARGVCLQLYVRSNQWVFWTAWALAIGLLLVISCVEKARRSFPTNMLLLGAFTAVQAFLVGTLSAYYNIEAVAIAFAVTSAAVIAITIFAINTKIDVTKYGTLLLVALVAFIVLLIMGMFWVNKVLWLVLSGIACLIFSAYLVSGLRTGLRLLWSTAQGSMAAWGSLQALGLAAKG
jgi:FtsH-binding integral membrane protein